MKKSIKRITAAIVGAAQVISAVSLGTLGMTAAAAAVEISTDTIAVGENHSLVIKSDMSLWAAGCNDLGQLGVEDIFESNGVKVMNNVVYAEANDDVSFAIDASGTLYGWGDNSKGQVSESGGYYVSKPMKLMEHVAAVCAGDTHTLALTEDGTLYGWGSNRYGELGFETNTITNKPTEIFKNVVDIAAGDGFSLFVTTEGALYAFGSNDYGQLGYGNYRDQSTPVLILKSGVASVEAGNNHAVILKTDGTVWTSGCNDDGQLGNKTFDDSNTFVSANLSGMSAVFAGGNSTAAVNKSGSIYTWGDNTYGQLHNGKTESLYAPASVTTGVVSIALAEEHSLMLKSNNSVSSAGAGAFGKLFAEAATSTEKPVKVLSDIIAYSAGEDHSAAVDASGNLYTWGNNDCGQLGLGDTVSRKKPTKVTLPEKAVNVWCGSKTTYVQTASKVYVFGSNSGNILGLSISQTTVTKPRENSDLAFKTSIQICPGDGYCLAVIDGRVFGWGKNFAGRMLSLPSSVSYPMLLSDSLTGVKKLAVGTNHVLALCGDTVYAWGGNTSGQLAMDVSTLVDEVTYVAISNSRGEFVSDKFADIAADGSHSMFVTTDGQVWVCGSNSYGQLGSDAYRIKTPYLTAKNASAVYAGNKACGILFIDGNLSLSGDNTYGALGDGTLKDRDDFLTNTGTKVVSASIGDGFGGYVDAHTDLYCWGNNMYGQVGNGSDSSKTSPEVVVRDALCREIVKADGISLNKNELVLKLAKSEQLIATVTPADVAAVVTWTSANPSVATVSANGTVTSVGKGSTIITARTSNGLSAECKVTTAVDVTSITATPSIKTINIGSTFTIATKVYPSTASDKSLKFTSSNKKVATVDENGKVTAVTAGKATITIRSNSKSTIYKKITVKVRPDKVKVTYRSSTTSGVKFKWEAAKGADGYDVFRKVSGSTASAKAIADAGKARTFTDKTAVKGKVYVYSIRSYKIIDGKKVYCSTYTQYKFTAK